MPNIMTSIDDPNDPAPELELLEEWKRCFPASYKDDEKLELENEETFSDDEILTIFGVDPTEKETIEEGLPVDEYMERYITAMKAEDWQAIADLWHTKLDYGLIKLFRALRAKNEPYL